MNEEDDILTNKAIQHVLSGNYDLAEELFKNYRSKMLDIVYEEYMYKLLFDKQFYRHYSNFYFYHHNFNIENDPCPPYRKYSNKLKKFDESDLDKRLLICGVMPLGDQILFTRFLSVILDITKNITVITLPRLVEHFSNAFPDVVFVKDDSHINVQDFDCVLYMPLISKFAFSEKNVPIKRLQPTAIADKIKVEKLRLHTKVVGKFIIGFSWRSARNNHNDYNDIGTAKNLLLRQLLPFFNIPNTVFVNLQHGNFQEELDDFVKKYNVTNIVTFEELDMSSSTQHIFNYIDMCDYIVSPTNTLAIMAGALHKKTFTLVPNKNSVGRLWMYHDIPEDRSHVFFPTVKMYEQDKLFRWEPAIELACNNLIGEIDET